MSRSMESRGASAQPWNWLKDISNEASRFGYCFSSGAAVPALTTTLSASPIAVSIISCSEEYDESW